MNILIMFFMVINFFTYSAYSMEKTDLADYTINPIDAKLLREVIKEEFESGLDIIQNIKDIIDNKITQIQSTIHTIDNDHDIVHKTNFIQTYFFGNKMSEYLLKNPLYSMSPRDKALYIKKLNKKVVSIKDALLAEKTAWNIILNSLAQDLSKEQLLLLLPEVLRIYVTNSVNYTNLTGGEWWINTMHMTGDILASLLVMIEIKDQSDVIDEILVFCHNSLGKPNWFWNSFISLMDIKDQDSPLWLSTEDKAFFHYKEVITNKVPSHINLKQTQLYHVLDNTVRGRSVEDDFLLLSKYSIFDGDINEYKKNMLLVHGGDINEYKKNILLEQSLAAEANYRSLLSEKNTKNNNKKVKPQKNNNKNDQKTRLPLPKHRLQSNKKAVITNHNTIIPYNIAPVTINNITDNNDDFMKVKQPKLSKPDKHEKTYPLIIKHIDNNKLRAKLSIDSYDNLVSLAKQRRLHQYEYDLHENILPINEIKGYQYNNIYYDLEKHFSILNKKTAEAALMKSKYDIHNESYINKELFANERKSTQQNLFTYFITFHVTNNDEKFTETYYGDVYSSSKAKSDIWISAKDMLTEEEKYNYDQSCNAFKNLYLCNFLADHCKQSAVDGCWLRNAKHTESNFVIDLSEHKLKKFIKDIYAKHPNIVNTIDAVVMGVVSEYDLCVRCQSLLQGLQWNLSHILQASLKQIKRRDMTQLVKINPDLITMIIAHTEKEIKNTKVKVENVKKFDQDLKLDDGENHRLFLYKNN